MSTVELRSAICVICHAEGDVTNKRYTQDEIEQEYIPYSGNYVFKRICTDCQNKFIHNQPDIAVRWIDGDDS